MLRRLSLLAELEDFERDTLRVQRAKARPLKINGSGDLAFLSLIFYIIAEGREIVENAKEPMRTSRHIPFEFRIKDGKTQEYEDLFKYFSTKLTCSYPGREN